MSKKKIVILSLIVFAGIIGYLIFRGEKTVKNNFFAVEKQDLIQEISAVGKVKPAENLNLAFEKTGVLTGVFVASGETAEKGMLLAQLDTTDAKKTVKDAEINLENAELALAKTNLQYEQLLRGDTLNKNCEDGVAILSGFYDETGTILNTLDDILFGTELSEKKENIQYYADYGKTFSTAPDRLSRLYQEAEKLREEGLADYQLAERGSGEIRNEAIRSGYDLAVKLAEITKSAKDIVRYFQDFLQKENLVHEKEAIINSHASTLAEYDLFVNDYLESLIVIINAIDDYYDKTESLFLDVKAQELLVQQRENTLAEAENNLAKHFLYSPINALVSQEDLKAGEVITANVSVIELISSSRFEIVADIYEEDIVKIKIGAPVEISLPAFPNETFEGKVFFIDEAEKIVNEVVYYETKIAFNQDPPEGIKPTMTSDLLIEVARRENVLVVPEEAIQEIDEKTTVKVFQDGKVEEKEVEIDLEGSNDMIEIISGLNEGEKVILD